MNGTIVIPTPIARAIRDLLADAPLESAGILYCHVAASDGFSRLLAQRFEPYRADAYLHRASDAITISPVAVNEHLQNARAEGLAIVQVHTHPGSDYARFSAHDNAGEVEMLPTMFGRVPVVAHGSLVVGERTWSARVYTDERSFTLARILEVGDSLVRRDRLDGEVALRDDRSARAMGREGQVALRQTRVAIIGLGGTGSIAAQELAYLGLHDVVLVD